MRFSIKTIMTIVAISSVVAWSWTVSWQLAMPVTLIFFLGWCMMKLYN